MPHPSHLQEPPFDTNSLSMFCSPLHFLTSGGGSKAWRGRGANEYKDLGLQFYYDGQGFAAVSMAPSFFHMDFYDISGNILHTLHLSKN